MRRPKEPAQQSVFGEFSCALIGADLLGETFRGPVAPRGDQRFTNGTLLGGPQPNVRGTTATPAALDGREGRGLAFDEELLLLRGELDHGPAALGIAQSRENAGARSKRGFAAECSPRRGAAATDRTPGAAGTVDLLSTP